MSISSFSAFLAPLPSPFIWKGNGNHMQRYRCVAAAVRHYLSIVRTSPVTRRAASSPLGPSLYLLFYTVQFTGSDDETVTVDYHD